MQKVITSCLAVLMFFNARSQEIPRTENIFIVTTDGFRWQEIFSGADSALLRNPDYTADTLLNILQYWDIDPRERRKKLMPFLWNVLARQGQLLGNRNYGNAVNVSNPYNFSYPGYREILTGYSDPFIFSNKKIVNSNTNILEYLNESKKYSGKVVAFSSWSLFPFILGQ